MEHFMLITLVVFLTGVHDMLTTCYPISYQREIRKLELLERLLQSAEAELDARENDYEQFERREWSDEQSALLHRQQPVEPSVTVRLLIILYKYRAVLKLSGAYFLFTIYLLINKITHITLLAYSIRSMMTSGDNYYYSPPPFPLICYGDQHMEVDTSDLTQLSSLTQA